MPDERVHKRRELMAPYRHPVRHSAVQMWRHQPELRRTTVIAVALGLGGEVGVAAGEPLLVLIAGIGAIMGAVVVFAWLVAILRETWRLRRSWGQRSELAAVRARRPQAGSEDADLAHHEFAVTAEEDGWLLTWRFRPLLVDEAPDEAEIEVPGRPRYAARAIDERQFDPRDAARAAEQLIAAQERAAERETAAATAAHQAGAAAAIAAELAVEAQSTAAALQRATGQRSRRD